MLDSAFVKGDAFEFQLELITILDCWVAQFNKVSAHSGGGNKASITAVIHPSRLARVFPGSF